MIQDQAHEAQSTQPEFGSNRARQPYLFTALRLGDVRYSGKAIAASFLLASIPLLQTSAGLVSKPQESTPTTGSDCQTHLNASVTSNQETSPAPAQNALIKQNRNSLLLPDKTSGVEQLSGKNALLIVDGENLIFGLRHEGWKLDFKAFRKKIASAIGLTEAHIYSTANDGARQRQSDFFYHAGFAPHINPIQVVETCRGQEVKANSDNRILLGLAERVTLSNPDVVILATGDGDLGCAVAEFLAGRSAKPAKLYIASIKGMTSERLCVANNATIEGNIWIGHDLVQPLTPRGASA